MNKIKINMLLYEKWKKKKKKNKLKPVGKWFILANLSISRDGSPLIVSSSAGFSTPVVLSCKCSFSERSVYGRGRPGRSNIDDYTRCRCISPQEYRTIISVTHYKYTLSVVLVIISNFEHRSYKRMLHLRIGWMLTRPAPVRQAGPPCASGRPIGAGRCYFCEGCLSLRTPAARGERQPRVAPIRIV